MGTAPKGPSGGDRPEPMKAGDLVLDRYRVVEQIAAGGHSVVFLGKDERLSRPVCIKVFSGLGGKSGVGRTSYEHFVQEAFALSRLTHPNTLRIYDFGHLGARDEEGMPLQVCEYMNAGTLATVVREHGNQSLAETARVIGAMCAALAEAHALGIVHRDIKPQNILFGTVGATKLPKLADFGIAKWSDDGDHEDEERAEDTQIVAGQRLAMYSPSWAAPEQLAGQPVNPSTDTYSLAVVAVYMLSSRAIFADEDVYAGYKKRRHADEHVRDALLALNVPKSAVALLTKALSFDPKQRIQAADELAQGLLAAVEARATLPMPALVVAPPILPNLTDPLPRPAPGDLDGPSSGLHAERTVELKRPRPSTPGPAPAPARAVTTPPALAVPTPPAPAAPPPLAQPRTRTLPLAPPPERPPPRARGANGPAPAPVAVPAPPPATPPSPAPAPSHPAGHHPARFLSPGSAAPPAVVGDRRILFCHVPGQIIDLQGAGQKVRITLMSSATGARVVHVKGLSCFVCPRGGRPSPALQIDQPGDIALVTPRAQEVGQIRVAIGSPRADGAHLFTIGAEPVALSPDDCSDPILFDFGPGSNAYFVYTRGRPAPVQSAPRPGRR